MGAKSSTQAGDNSSPRGRTFSTSSSSEVVSGPTLNFLRAIPNAVVSGDRQRARSLSSVPDSNSGHENIGVLSGNRTYDISESPETDSGSEDHVVLDGPMAANISLGRVYAAHSLPSHIWTINGKSQ